MQKEFYNQPVVNWAKHNLAAQPIEIKLLFGSRWVMWLVYLLLYSIPLLIVAASIFLKLTGGEGTWLGVVLCSGVMLAPPSLIVLLGAITRQKFVKSLDAGGIRSSMGRRFLWENLYYVDHVSKITRVGNVSRKIEDNQLELVFADGKAIIPPLIKDRQRIWDLINSIPAQVKFDGEIKTAQPQANIGEYFMKELERLAAEDKRNKQ